MVVIHHPRKGGANGGRAGDALRGHSSIEAAVDLALHVMREPNTSEVSVRSTKTRGVDVQPVLARFNYQHAAGTDDLAAAWFDGQPVKRGDSDLRDAILHHVGAYGQIAKMKLVQVVQDALGQDAPGVNKIRAWIDDMLANEAGITEVQNGKYRLICLS